MISSLPDGAPDIQRRAPSSSSFYALLHILRRRATTVAVGIVFVAGSAYAYSSTQKPIYAASADVLLSRQNLATSLNNITDPASTTSDYNRIAQTQANLATAPTVIRLTLKTAGLPESPTDLLTQHSTVTAKPNADILTFEVENGDRATATRLASAYARSYTIYRRTVDTFGVDRALSEVRQRIKSLRASSQRNRPLLESLQTNEQQLSTLAALQTSNAFLVRDPKTASQVSPKPLRSLLIGLLVGVLVGIGLALLRDSLDKRVKDPDEIGEQLGLPLLARIPELPRRNRQAHDLAMLSEPTGPNAEAFRVLKTNVEFATIDGHVKTIMVSSAVQGEGKSTTAANLAIAFARAGNRVVLVDADLRRPYVAKFFGLEGKSGLTDVALGRVGLQAAMTDIDVSTTKDQLAMQSVVGLRGGLRVITSGLMPPDTGEFIGSQRLKRILDDLAQDADIVLLDSPPLLSVGDALTLSAHADALLYVALLTVVRRSMFKDVRRLLDTVQCRVLGHAVAGVPLGLSYGYSYGGGYTATNGEIQLSGAGNAKAPAGTAAGEHTER